MAGTAILPRAVAPMPERMRFGAVTMTLSGDRPSGGHRPLGPEIGEPVRTDAEVRLRNCVKSRTRTRRPTRLEDRMPKKKSSSKDRPVIVTTAHRGVFFGYTEDTEGETIRLKRSRLCIYWSRDVKGFMGLASSGPTAGCRIGPSADITLRNITAVIEVSPGAVKAWEAAPWSA